MPTHMLQQPYFATMGPAIIITITAFIVMILEFLVRGDAKRWLSGLSMLGVIGALIDAIATYNSPPKLLLNTVVTDAISSVFTVIILVAALLVLLFTFDYTGKVRLAAEHTYLILFGLVGALVMASSIDLVSLYIGLELLSVSSYVLVAVRRESVRSIEGGIKYLIMGSVGSAVLLYGMSFIYGISGTTNLESLGQAGQMLFAQYPAIFVLSFLLMLIGMGVKLSLVPFHMWTPDAYAGAPSPITAFLATLSKTASFGMLLRMLLFIFNGAASHVFYWAGILAAITMVVGNAIALPQRNMKRLLAFSSIAQAGYILIPFALFGTAPYSQWISIFDSISFYLFAYTFMTIGAFAIVHVIAHQRRSQDVDALSGLYRQSPWLAVALTIFVLSLAGMPLTAGFVGKFYIFADALHLHAIWLAVLLFATSVMSFYYYFGWLRKIFEKPEDVATENVATGTSAPFVSTVASGTAAGVRIAVSPAMHTLVAICVAGTVILGLVPAAFLHTLAVTHWF